jgi:hypothetical protein
MRDDVCKISSCWSWRVSSPLKAICRLENTGNENPDRHPDAGRPESAGQGERGGEGADTDAPRTPAAPTDDHNANGPPQPDNPSRRNPDSTSPHARQSDNPTPENPHPTILPGPRDVPQNQAAIGGDDVDPGYDDDDFLYDVRDFRWRGPSVDDMALRRDRFSSELPPAFIPPPISLLLPPPPPVDTWTSSFEVPAPVLEPWSPDDVRLISDVPEMPLIEGNPPNNRITQG